MSLVKRNVIANLIGGALLTILTIVITPLQINILGMEAYGVVGFITTLQIAFTAFDLGLSSTLTRELAADSSADKHRSLGLIRTASTIYWSSALVIGAVMSMMAGEISRRWFNASTIEVSLLEKSLRVIALYLGLRWPVALYAGVLMGLQRMEVMNAIKVAVAAVRLIGGIGVLLHWRNLYAFLIWTSFNALVEVAAYWYACRLLLPSMATLPGMSRKALQKVWRFSASMNALAILTVIIVQMDRLMISKMLTLALLGVYSLAYNAAAIIPAIIGAISSAVMPSFAAAYGQRSAPLLVNRYIGASRFMLYAIGLIVATFVFFGEPILALWVSRGAAASAAQPLALLAIGFWGSGVVSCAYNVAVASGQPGMVLKVSFYSVAPYTAVLYWLISWRGVAGAAVAWILLNAVYIVIILPLVHRRILRIPVSPFVAYTMLPFLTLAVLSFLPSRLVTSGWHNSFGSVGEISAFAVSVALYVGIGFCLLGKEMRAVLTSSVRWPGWRRA